MRTQHLPAHSDCSEPVSHPACYMTTNTGWYRINQTIQLRKQSGLFCTTLYNSTLDHQLTHIIQLIQFYILSYYITLKSNK